MKYKNQLHFILLITDIFDVTLLYLSGFDLKYKLVIVSVKKN